MSRDLVVLSLEPWDEVWRRNQYLIDGLLRGDRSLRVLFVEPSNDLLHGAISRHRLRRGRGLRVADGYEGRLHLYQPDKVLPRVAGPAADALLRRSVRSAIRRVGMRAPILWVNDPSWAGLVARESWSALYDMTDDWLAAQRSAREHRRTADNERVLMNQCRTVVVCSEGLLRTRSPQREVVLITNAVDLARYRAERPRPAGLPEGRTATYVGTLHEDRLDVELVVRTADALSDGSTVVLVGPNALSAQNTSRLVEHPRIELLGARPWTDIPAYLQHADVLLVPHLVNDFTESLDPLKLYEYRAVGRPVVSTPVAGFRDSGEGVVVAAAADFSDAVARVAASDVPTARHDGIPEWSHRVAQYADVLSNM
ncbi:glycosyltransferase [Microbacterium lacticum]